MENTYNYEEQIRVASAFKKRSHVGLCFLLYCSDSRFQN